MRGGYWHELIGDMIRSGSSQSNLDSTSFIAYEPSASADLMREGNRKKSKGGYGS
jgi:hypothetical protein